MTQNPNQATGSPRTDAKVYDDNGTLLFSVVITSPKRLPGALSGTLIFRDAPKHFSVWQRFQITERKLILQVEDGSILHLENGSGLPIFIEPISEYSANFTSRGAPIPKDAMAKYTQPKNS